METPEIAFLKDIVNAVGHASAVNCPETMKREEYTIIDGVIFINPNPKEKGKKT